MPFVVHDTETTGTSHHFDQILQFAAIATDDDLNEVGKIASLRAGARHEAASALVLIYLDGRLHLERQPGRYGRAS